MFESGPKLNTAIKLLCEYPVIFRREQLRRDNHSLSMVTFFSAICEFVVNMFFEKNPINPKMFFWTRKVQFDRRAQSFRSTFGKILKFFKFFEKKSFLQNLLRSK